jgi:hypothetical protein
MNQRGLDQSIAVAAWQTRLTESLPEELRGSLPTIEEIEAELAGDFPPESPKHGESHDYHIRNPLRPSGVTS